MTVPLTESAVGRTTFTEQVYTELKRRILGGLLPAGSRLMEKECAEEFNVSATPVREAFNKLRVDGLLRYSPWQGNTVTKLTAEDVRGLFSVREVLESLAVRESGPRLRESDIGSLRENIDSFREIVEGTSADSRDLHHLNEEFHRFFLDRCGNTWLSSTMSSLVDLVILARASLAMKSAGDRSLAEHEEVLRHLVASDWDGAANAMAAHIRRVKLEALGSIADQS